MKALIQRVNKASVSVENKFCGKCGKGFLILFCAVEGDDETDIEVLAKKTVNLRIFEDEDGKMNRSLTDVGGEILCISQFTLAADTKKGNRPSFINAMRSDTASEMYDKFCELLNGYGVKTVEKGIFGADMQVTLVNDGPVTIMLDTESWRKK